MDDSAGGKGAIGETARPTFVPEREAAAGLAPELAPDLAPVPPVTPSASAP